MKKKHVLFLLMSYGTYSNAQTNAFPGSGNVGIGTTSPTSALTVEGDIHSTGIIGGSGSYINVLKVTPLNSSPAFFYINTSIPANDSSAPQIQITGYTYGVANKAMKITLGWYHYQGNFYWSQWQSDLGYRKPSRIRLGRYLKEDGQPYIRLEIANDGIYWANYSVSATDAGNHATDYYKGWSFNEGEMPENVTSQIHTVPQNQDVTIDGNLNIGTSTPGLSKLSVNGNIRAREIKVENSNWPDYVFAKSYRLPTLEETEKYINEKGHLSGIPSAEKVKLDGVSLGEMNAVLLKKIEELTLYLIEQNKEIKELRKEVQNLKLK